VIQWGPLAPGPHSTQGPPHFTVQRPTLPCCVAICRSIPPLAVLLQKGAFHATHTISGGEGPQNPGTHTIPGGEGNETLRPPTIYRQGQLKLDRRIGGEGGGVSVGLTWLRSVSLGLTWFTWRQVNSLSLTWFQLASLGFT